MRITAKILKIILLLAFLFLRSSLYAYNISAPKNNNNTHQFIQKNTVFFNYIETVKLSKKLLTELKRALNGFQGFGAKLQKTDTMLMCIIHGLGDIIYHNEFNAKLRIRAKAYLRTFETRNDFLIKQIQKQIKRTERTTIIKRSLYNLDVYKFLLNKHLKTKRSRSDDKIELDIQKNKIKKGV
ncbi:hypothetical protein ACFL4S_00130 [bacterium]